ncbi:MAG: hypothetical protein A2Y92_02335, partial [Chloroflexi bacterium RBG_13_57_8]
RPLFSWILIILNFVLATGAITSGPMLFLKPDGSLMKWTVDLLEGTPFPDFLIPGIILFVLLGIYPLIVGLGLVKTTSKWLEVINPLKKYHWAWTGSLGVGIILLIWIITETSLLGYISFLQPVMTVWGLLILVVALLPGVRRYYKKP